jgi:hypothetical protein
MGDRPTDQAVVDAKKLAALSELIVAIVNRNVAGQRLWLRIVCKWLLGRKPTGAELRNAGSDLNLGD